MKLTAKVLSVMLVLLLTLSLVPGITLRAAAEGEPTFTLSKSNMNLATSGTTTGTLTVSDVDPSDATVTWESENLNVASVSPTTGNSVTVTAVGEGTTSIKATVTSGDKSTVHACSVRVGSAIPSVTVADRTVPIGQQTELTATTVPEDAAVTWTSDNPTEFIISNEGGKNYVNIAETVGDGDTATLTARITVNGIDYTDDCTITATDPDEPVTDDDPYIDISYRFGTTENGYRVISAPDPDYYTTILTAKVKNPDGTDYSPQPSSTGWTWTSSNPSVAQVVNGDTDHDNSVTIKGMSVGTANITVSTTVGDKTISKNVPIKVKSPEDNPGGDDDTATGFSLEPYRGDDMPLYVGKSYPITGSNGLVEVCPTPAGSTLPEIKWSVDPKSAGPDKDNNIKPTKTGKVTITAKSKDGKISASRTFKVIGYICKSGAGQTYTKGSNKILPFVIANSDSDRDKNDSTYDYFKNGGCQVHVTGNGVNEKLDPGTDFLHAEGSVRLSLLPDYLDTLDPGTYYLTATFAVPSEGPVDSESIKFIVKKKGAGSGSNPDTADMIYIGLGVFMFLLALTYVALFTYDKKQRKLRLRRRIAAHHRRYY